MNTLPSALSQRQIRDCLGLSDQEPPLCFTRIGDDEGFVGCLWRVKPSSHGSKISNRTLIVKTVANFSDDMPIPLVDFFRGVQPHLRECSLYCLLQHGRVVQGSDMISVGYWTEIEEPFAKRCGCLPACFGVTAGDEFGGEKMLLMQDLSDHFSPAFAEGMTASQCHEAVSKLAEFHAHTKTKLATMREEDCRVFVPWHWEAVRDDAVQLFADALQGKLSAEGDAFLRHAGAQYLTERCCGPHAQSLPARDDCFIIHGDCWSSNVMFSSSGEASLIDFQFCRLGQPEVDLAVLLCTSASSPDLRRGQCLAGLLRSYSEAYRRHFDCINGTSKPPDHPSHIDMSKYHAALAHALHVIVLSYETWTTNFPPDNILYRFASVVEDIAKINGSV